MTQTTQSNEAPEKKKPIPGLPEGLEGQRFYIIQFPAGRKELGDPPRIPVNTPNYKAQQGLARSTPLPVPGEVVEALEHSTYINWRNVEGKNRKVGTEQHRYPFSRICEISMEGYIKLRQKALKEPITEADYLQYKI